MLFNTNPAYTFDDFWLVPQHSHISSRDIVSLETNLFPRIKRNKYKVQHPLMASPMDSVCGSKMLATMALMGGTGVLHRGCSPQEQFGMLLESMDIAVKKIFQRTQTYNVPGLFGIAVGINWEERVNKILDELENLNFYDENVRIFFCLDVAHADSSQYINSLKNLHERLSGLEIPILAGSIATEYALHQLMPYCEGVRVGIGCGSACSTRIQTGHGVPLATSIMECRNYLNTTTTPFNDLTLICDGGMKTPGDMVKALACGCTGIMLGGYLSATSDSPAEKIYEIKNNYRTYNDEYDFYNIHEFINKNNKITGVKFRGMASYAAQKAYCEKDREPLYVEGESIVIPYRGNTTDVLTETLASIRSGLSYSGCIDIESFYKNAELRLGTFNGVYEAHPHAKMLQK